MKRTIIILALCFFIFSLANARSLGITIDKNEVDAYSELYIEYEIDIGEEDTFTYEIGIRNGETISLLEKTVTTDKETGTIAWNTENFEAGVYEAYIFMEPDIRWPSRKFEILPTFDFELDVEKLEVFVYKEDSTKSFVINNTGNVPIFVSLAQRGVKSRAEIVPLTYNIDVGESRTFLFSVEKPENHYEALLIVEASWEDRTIEKEIPLIVYNPVVEITAEDIELTKTNESQIVTGKIINNGNVRRDITIIFNVDEEKQEEIISLDVNETFEIENEFSLDEKVKSIEITYIGSDGEEETIKESFTWAPSLPKIPFLDIETLKDNFNYLILGALLLVGILFVLYRKGGNKIKK